jgi:two-component system NtrC family sensor kinase
MLAVGIPERKYTEMRKDALLVFFGITLGGVVLAVGISTFGSRRITRSIRGIVDAVQDVARGNFDRQVEPDPEIAEFYQVGEGFNRMAASLKERDLQLKFRTQEQIGKSERLAMIGRLAAGVAHEINNPLGGIMLFSNLLLRKLPAEGPAHENAERICTEAKRCQKIVQGLLDFARHREPKAEPMDVHDVLDRTLQLVEKQALFLNIETIRDYGADIRLVRADPGQLEQVFINLIFNAAEAMQGKGRLTISTEAVDRGDGVRLAFADTGCGISADNLERLFEPFFTTKDVGHGTGLGLSVSRGIIENHGGSIWATSRVGEGTTFFIRLPTIPSAG